MRTGSIQSTRVRFSWRTSSKGSGSPRTSSLRPSAYPPRRINEIVHGKRGITADTAVRLAKYFGTSAELWMNLQSHYELRLERRALREQLERIVPLQSVA